MDVNIIKIMSGDDEPIVIECRNPENNQPIDISGFINIKFTVRDNNKRQLIQKSLNNGISFATDGSDGILHLTLNKEDTANLCGSYIYDLEFVDNNGVTTTPVKSYIIIGEDITR